MTLFGSSSQRVRLSEPLHNTTTFPWAGWVSVFPERQSAGGQREGRMRGGKCRKNSGIFRKNGHSEKFFWMEETFKKRERKLKRRRGK